MHMALGLSHWLVNTHMVDLQDLLLPHAESTCNVMHRAKGVLYRCGYKKKMAGSNYTAYIVQWCRVWK